MIYESNYYPQIMPQKYEINSNNYGKYHKKSQYMVKITHQSVFSVILCEEKTVLLLAHEEPLLMSLDVNIIQIRCPIVSFMLPSHFEWLTYTVYLALR